uniref:CUB domain-containing protein n=1 Tax=Ciona savignyi TaxID=51511 RepID=H2Z774_CIOSA
MIGNYSSNLRCTWVIRATIGKRVKFCILAIHLERRFRDTFKIYNGPTSASPRLITLSGYHHYTFCINGRNVLTVELKTNGRNNHPGFKASYRTYVPDSSTLGKLV